MGRITFHVRYADLPENVQLEGCEQAREGWLACAGMETYEAVLEAGPIRMRPVLMTAVSTIFGMRPVALATGDGAEWRNPMGIGGLCWVVIHRVADCFGLGVGHAFERQLERIRTLQIERLRADVELTVEKSQPGQMNEMNGSVEIAAG